MLPGATYVDPELSWKYESGPAGTTFVSGTALGANNEGTLWIGSSRSFQQVGGTGGSLYRLKLSRNRRKVDVYDPKLAEGVVDTSGATFVVVMQNCVLLSEVAASVDCRGSDRSLVDRIS